MPLGGLDRFQCSSSATTRAKLSIRSYSRVDFVKSGFQGRNASHNDGYMLLRPDWASSTHDSSVHSRQTYFPIMLRVKPSSVQLVMLRTMGPAVRRTYICNRYDVHFQLIRLFSQLPVHRNCAFPCSVESTGGKPNMLVTRNSHHSETHQTC